jgi:uncharacterized repeat protein (TIGR01451 family)
MRVYLYLASGVLNVVCDPTHSNQTLTISLSKEKLPMNRRLALLSAVGLTLVLLAMLSISFSAQATSIESLPAQPQALLLAEDFDYGATAMSLTIASGNWVAHSGAGSVPVQYITTSLSMPGYGSSGVGGAATVAISSINSAEDVNRSFTSQISGTMYFAALVNVSAATSGGDYFLHFKNASTSGFPARVAARSDTGTLRFGLSASSASPVYNTTISYTFGTTYLVVAKYNIGTGATALYVLDTFSSIEPATAVVSFTTGITETVQQIAIRQGGNTTRPTATIDGIRVATTWADVVGYIAPPAEANLGVTKSGPTAANTGNWITYTLKISNTGNLTATSTLVTDTLPASLNNVTYTTASTVAFTQSSANEWVWDLGDVASGGAETAIEVWGQVASTVVNGTILTNTVTASTSATETNTANNTKQVTTTINAPALGLAKTATPNVNVAYHGEVTYTVVLNNSGSVAAVGTLFTDTLPAEVNFARWVDQPSGAGEVADEITWIGTVAAGSPVTFTFIVTHVGAYGEVVANTAHFDYLNGSGSANASFTVVSATPNLSILKTVTPDTFVQHHSEVTYTIMLNNGGAAQADNVALTDTLPLSTTFARWVNQPSGVGEAAGVINWTGTVTAASSLDFVFVVTQTTDYNATITNTAEFAHTSGSGSADAVFTVEPTYPVTFVYHDGEDVIQAGDSLYLAGSFNGWSTSITPMTGDASNTTFSVTLNLPAGMDEYRYVVNSGSDHLDWLQEPGGNGNRVYTVTTGTIVNDYRKVVVDWAKLQSPPVLATTFNTATSSVYGRVRIETVTNPSGEGRGIHAQVGYGASTTPATWTWFPMTYNVDDGTNDEFAGVITPTAAGVFSYATRFNGNWGAGNPISTTWTYGDLNGTDDGFSLDQAGVLTVTLPSVPLIINEFDAQTPGTDTAEFIELYDGGVGNTSLNNIALVWFNGGAINDASYRTIDLNGYHTNANGYFVVGNSAIASAIITFPNNTLQNGQDAIGLFFGNAAIFPDGTPVTNTNLIDAVVYDDIELTATNDPALLAVLTPGQPMVYEGPITSTADINSAGRCPNGSGGARHTLTYQSVTPTPNGSNICPAPAVTSVYPADAAVNVAVSTDVTATFNMSMTNVNSATFTLRDPLGAVAGAVTYDAAALTATFNPTADLLHGTRYTATLSADLLASNGMTFTQDYVWSFTTEALPANLSTSTKTASASGRIAAGSLVTYTITLSNTGITNATVSVIDVLGSYYTVANTLDFIEGPVGTLVWVGDVAGSQSVTLHFVARVKSLTQLPVGLTTLNNTATIDDGVNPAFAVIDASPPYVQIEQLYLPLIRR